MAFSTYLKESKLARNIFGKKKIEIMIKQLKVGKLTQSERNRLSRDVRPKLEAIREIAMFQNEFSMKKGQFTLFRQKI